MSNLALYRTKGYAAFLSETLKYLYITRHQSYIKTEIKKGRLA